MIYAIIGQGHPRCDLCLHLLLCDYYGDYSCLMAFEVYLVWSSAQFSVVKCTICLQFMIDYQEQFYKEWHGQAQITQIIPFDGVL